jgi:hypothetical protein
MCKKVYIFRCGDKIFLVLLYARHICHLTLVYSELAKRNSSWIGLSLLVMHLLKSVSNIAVSC